MYFPLFLSSYTYTHYRWVHKGKCVSKHMVALEPLKKSMSSFLDMFLSFYVGRLFKIKISTWRTCVNIALVTSKFSHSTENQGFPISNTYSIYKKLCSLPVLTNILSGYKTFCMLNIFRKKSLTTSNGSSIIMSKVSQKISVMKA